MAGESAEGPPGGVNAATFWPHQRFKFCCSRKLSDNRLDWQGAWPMIDNANWFKENRNELSNHLQFLSISSNAIADSKKLVSCSLFSFVSVFDIVFGSKCRLFGILLSKARKDVFIACANFQKAYFSRADFFPETDWQPQKQVWKTKTTDDSPKVVFSRKLSSSRLLHRSSLKAPSQRKRTKTTIWEKQSAGKHTQSGCLRKLSSNRIPPSGVCSMMHKKKRGKSFKRTKMTAKSSNDAVRCNFPFWNVPQKDQQWNVYELYSIERFTTFEKLHADDPFC